MVCLLFSMFSFSGCSRLFLSIAEDEIEKFIEDVFDGYINEQSEESLLHSVFPGNRISDIPVLTEEQNNAYQYSLKLASYSIESIDINKNRSKAVAVIKIQNVIDYSNINLGVGTIDEINSTIEKEAKSDLIIKLKLLRDENSDWYFDSVDEVFKYLKLPYAGISFVDEDGNPINLTSEYVASLAISTAWYDPLIGNPYSEKDNIVLDSPVALKPAFYFSRPISLTFSCELVNLTTEEKITKTQDVKDSVVVVYDFSDEDYELNPGDYCCTLYYNDVEIITSKIITVR